VGERDIVIDLDPQGNASTGLGVPEEARHVSTYDVLAGAAARWIRGHDTDSSSGLSLRRHADLAGLEPEISPHPTALISLRDAIASLRAQRKDRAVFRAPWYVLIDCPPSLSILTLNALAAADAALVRFNASFFAPRGSRSLKETIDFDGRA